ncbi:MAG: permease-like cell division protein FtsX [Crocinitomicaceae bacterium]|nr:permease-like cell division protein FtsX [Crocinitomicaceae bacterium]
MAANVDKLNKRGVKSSYVSTIIGISLVLFMIGIVLGGVFGLENIQRQAKENLQGDLFFKPEMNPADIKQVEQELNTWEQFNEVFYVSPERAIEEFSGQDQNADNILAIFEGDNPLPPTVGFKPKVEFATLEGMEQIKADLLANYGDRLDEVSYDEASVKSVNLGFKQFVYLFGAIAFLLIIVAVAMINNTIRLALYSKRFSIKTMQLVGATSGYIRRPFLIQAIGIGVLSGLIAMALLFGMFYALNNLVDSLEITYSIQMFLILLGSLLIIGVIITYISTWFALNKYLRMKLDDLY